MQTPIFTDLQHLAPGYDPNKAHEYYLRTRKLKGRHGQTVTVATDKGNTPAPSHNPFQKEGVKNLPRSHHTKTQQKKELAAKIHGLEQKLQKLEELIRKKEHAAASENRKSTAKKERAAKEKDKPKTAAEKAKLARDNAKYRDKHKQELKTKAKQASSKSGGGHSSTSKTKSSGASLESLVRLAVKVKGQISVAKQKLAAL